MKNLLQFAWFFVLPVLYPLLLLFTPDAVFSSIDWYNHLWQARYFADFFKAHGSMPHFIHTAEFLGLPQPLFYGGLFYSGLGFLSSYFPVVLVARVVFVVVFFLQFILVYRLFFHLRKSKTDAWALAVLIQWATYPLTNLYSRGALTEFVAVSLLTSAIALGFHFVFEIGTVGQRTKLWAVGFLMLFVIGTHPITGALGVVLFGLVGLASAPLWWKKPMQRNLILTHVPLLLAVGFLALGPWVYVVYHWGSQTFLGRFFKEVIYHPGIDDFWLRFFPIPLDPRIAAEGTSVSTPYLEAQLNQVLLVFLCVQTFFVLRQKGMRSLRGLAGVSVAGFLLVTAISAIPHLFPTPDFLYFIQFAYRWISYQNLFLMIFALAIWRSISIPKFLSVFFVGWAAICVGVKLYHVFKTDKYFEYKQAVLAEPAQSSLHLPQIFYGARDYAVSTVPGLLESLTERPSRIEHLRFGVGLGKEWGKPLPLDLEMSEKTLCVTNVLTFPWAKIIVDGVPLKEGLYSLAVQRTQVFVYAFSLPPGRHRLTVEWEADPIWVRLSRVAFWATLLWAVGLFFAIIQTQRHSALQATVSPVLH